jgi:hypothetical protein
MPKHPEPHIRRAVRVLAMVGELHKRGFQRLRVMPFMSPCGMQWRAWIGPSSLFHRNHGAIMAASAAAWPDDEGQQAIAQVARYTSGHDKQYFGWRDAEKDDARSLADKFAQRFRALVDASVGSDFPYAGWYVRLLGLAEAGWLPCVIADCAPVLFDRVPLDDMRPAEWRRSNDETP